MSILAIQAALIVGFLALIGFAGAVVLIRR